MSFALFDYDEKIPKLFERNERENHAVLEDMYQYFDNKVFPQYVRNYLKQEWQSGPKGLISFHKPSGFGTAGNKYTDEEKQNIRRTKGIFATNEYRRSEYPKARHHLKVFYNDKGKARLFYKINGGAIKFIQNRK